MNQWIRTPSEHARYGAIDRTSQPRADGCLIVGPDSLRREQLVTAAQRAGWQTLESGSLDQVTALVDRAPFHLAIVDLPPDGHRDDDAWRRLAERLAPSSRSLLIVCSAEGAPEKEIWARQLGVWLYVPGNDVAGRLTIVCAEARQVVAKNLARTTHESRTFELRT